MLPQYLPCFIHHGFAASVRSVDKPAWSPIANYYPFLMVQCWNAIWPSLYCCKWWDTSQLWIICSENHCWNLAVLCNCFQSPLKTEFSGCWFVSCKLPAIGLGYRWAKGKEQMKKCSEESIAVVFSSACFSMFRVNLMGMQLACEIPHHIR